jgi:hypothetical protein
VLHTRKQIQVSQARVVVVTSYHYTVCQVVAVLSLIFGRMIASVIKDPIPKFVMRALLPIVVTGCSTPVRLCGISPNANQMQIDLNKFGW